MIATEHIKVGWRFSVDYKNRTFEVQIAMFTILLILIVSSTSLMSVHGHVVVLPINCANCKATGMS